MVVALPFRTALRQIELAQLQPIIERHRMHRAVAQRFAAHCAVRRVADAGNIRAAGVVDTRQTVASLIVVIDDTVGRIFGSQLPASPARDLRGKGLFIGFDVGVGFQIAATRARRDVVARNVVGKIGFICFQRSGFRRGRFRPAFEFGHWVQIPWQLLGS